MTARLRASVLVALALFAGASARADEPEHIAINGDAPRRESPLKAGQVAPFDGKLLETQLANEWIASDVNKTAALKACEEAPGPGINGIVIAGAIGLVAGLTLAVLGGALGAKAAK